MKSIQREILEYHLKECRPYFKGILLNAGCGDITYEFIYKNWVDNLVLYDWPQTVHNKDSIDLFGSVMELPFADNVFDVVLCTEVLEHIPEPQKTLSEFFRVLKPTGHVILSVPFIYQMHEQPYDFFRYTYYGLRYLLEKSGFLIISCEARGEILAVNIYFLEKFVERIISKIFGSAFSKKINFRILDRIYLYFMRRKIFHLEGSWTNYTLGYTVIAQKK